MGTSAILERGTQGTAVRSVNAGPFTVTETWHGPGVRLAWHAHARPCLNVLLQGCAEERVSTRGMDCVPGSLWVKPGGSYHANHYGDRGARALLIEVEDDATDALGPAARVFADFSTTPGTGCLPLGHRIRRELHEGDRARDLVIEGLVLQLLGQAVRWLDAVEPRRAAPPWLRLVRERLREEAAAPPTAQRLAAEAGVDAATLENAFRRHYGAALGDELRRSRLEWAAGELTNTDRTAGEIALEAGFYDQSHFTRHFRAVYELPPGRYRRAARRRP